MNNEVKSIKVLTGHLTATNKKVVSMILDNREDYKDENGNFVGNRGGITYTIKQKSDTEFKVTTREKDKDMSGRVIWRDYSSDVVINYKPKIETKEMKSVNDVIMEIVKEDNAGVVSEATTSGNTVYMACEFDDYRSSSSRVIQGIFTTEEKAIKALTKLYGKLESDSNGGSLGFKPVKNPHDVTLQVVKVKLDDIGEV